VDILSIDYSGLFRQISCPAFYISADRGISTSADISQLQAWIPHLQVAHVPNAGHNIRREQFARYLEVVIQFLNTSLSQ
jgi:N-formylmaleamate deformylase